MKYLILSILLFSMASCAQRDKRTEIFDDYLKRLYNVSIPEAPHNYIVFPENVGCVGCSIKTYNFIMGKKLPDVTLICSEKLTATMPPGIKYPVLVDTFSEIERMNLETQNVGIIATKDHRIDRIISLQVNNIDSILPNYFRATDILASN